MITGHVSGPRSSGVPGSCGVPAASEGPEHEAPSRRRGPCTDRDLLEVAGHELRPLLRTQLPPGPLTGPALARRTESSVSLMSSSADVSQIESSAGS